MIWHAISLVVLCLLWLAFLPYLFRHRALIGQKTRFCIVASIILHIYAFSYDLVERDFETSWNAWAWYPASLFTLLAFVFFIRARIELDLKIKNWKPKK